MEFAEVLEMILEACPFLKDNEYDGIIVKKLAATNTISDTGSSHQSHMAFTGKQKDFFPFLNADGYFNVGYESKDDDLKKYFTLQIPMNIYAENVAVLKRETISTLLFSSNFKTVKASVLRSRRNNGDDQIELSIKSLDDKDFIEFRKLLRVDDFFVLLKRKNELNYDLVGIPSTNRNATILASCNDFYKIGTQTPVGIENFDTEFNDNKNINSNLPFPRNHIVFGAPGTGKSHLLERNRKENFAEDCYERVTFHPNSSYAQFVGTYKPTMAETETNSLLTDEQKQILTVLKDKNKTGQEKYDSLYDKFRGDSLTRLPLLLGIYTDDSFKTKKADGSPTADDNTPARNNGKAIRPYVNLNTDCSKEEITYEYIPGPFMRIYIAAKQNPSQNFLLLIEEINRANVAAVFGDVFQLLDRKSDGTSEYPITTSEDLRKFLAKSENLGGNPDDYKTLSIPSNMYIWATMNSADQGVFPMDTAFKRRWEFEYIGIDDGEKKEDGTDDETFASYALPIPSKYDNKKKLVLEYQSIKWNIIRHAINDKLKEISGVNEDKLLGPYFLSKTLLEKSTKGSAENNNEEKAKICSSFKSKVLMYLYEDVVKMNPTELFNKEIFPEGKPLHYSDLCLKFDEIGLEIFGKDFIKES